MKTGFGAQGLVLNKRKITSPALSWRGSGERKTVQECWGRGGQKAKEVALWYLRIRSSVQLLRQ